MNKKEAGTEVLKQPLIMSIRKTGIHSTIPVFLLRTMKKKNTVFCPSLFFYLIFFTKWSNSSPIIIQGSE